MNSSGKATTSWKSIKSFFSRFAAMKTLLLQGLLNGNVI